MFSFKELEVGRRFGDRKIVRMAHFQEPVARPVHEDTVVYWESLDGTTGVCRARSFAAYVRGTQKK